MATASMQRRGRPTDEQAERRLAEKDGLARAYRADLRRRTEALRDGPHGEPVRALMSFARTMTLQDGPELLRRVEASGLANAMGPADRHLMLSILGAAIGRLRERNGLPALDDPFPDQPPNVFQRVKQILQVR